MIITSAIILVFVVAGFEETTYTVHETDSMAEVCIRVFNPPANEALAFAISLEYTTRQDTAGKLNDASNW